MMPLALSAALCFSMVLRPQVQVHRCQASSVASRHAPALAQFGDFLKKGKAVEDDGESDEPVEYFFDPANAEEDDPDPSPPMAEAEEEQRRVAKEHEQARVDAEAATAEATAAFEAAAAAASETPAV